MNVDEGTLDASTGFVGDRSDEVNEVGPFISDETKPLVDTESVFKCTAGD